MGSPDRPRRKRKGGSKVNGTSVSAAAVASPSAARLPISSKSKQQQSKPRRERGTPYVPGHYDRLIAVPDRVPADQLRGVTIAVAASGTAVIVSEQTADGQSPRRIVELNEPVYFDLKLRGGRSVQVELRVFDDPADPTAEELIVRPDDGPTISNFFWAIKEYRG